MKNKNLRPEQGFSAISLCKGKSAFESRAAEAIALAQFGLATEPIVKSAPKRSAVMALLEIALWHFPRFVAFFIAAYALKQLRGDR